MSNPILEVESVSKSFGRKRVLDQVSFHAERGKITGIIGENGSGKTTLLKIIVGLLSATNGTTRLHGSTGYCPQEQLVFSSLTLRENLNFFATAYGLSRAADQDWKSVVEELVERFRLGDYLDMLVSKLSGGTKQKLNLCLALIHSPDLLILDEPYAAFDWESYLYFWDFVTEFKERGKSFLIVSHIIYDRSIIDQVYELKEGQLKCE